MAAWNPFFLKARSPALARWFLPGGKSIFVPFQRSGLETIFRTSSQRGARKFLCGRSPKPPRGSEWGASTLPPPSPPGLRGSSALPELFLGNCLNYSPPSGDYFKYHPQAWQRKAGEKQGWCQDTRSRVRGRIAALSFDFSCEGQGTFPAGPASSWQGWYLEKGLQKKGGSSRPRDALQSPESFRRCFGEGRVEAVFTGWGTESRSNDFLCARRGVIEEEISVWMLPKGRRKARVNNTAPKLFLYLLPLHTF